MNDNGAVERQRDFVEGGAWEWLRVVAWVALGTLIGVGTVGVVIRLATASETPEVPVAAPASALAPAPDDDLDAAEDPEATLGADGALPPAPSEKTIPINRRWDVLTAPPTPEIANSLRPTLRQVGELLGDWQIRVAGARLTGPRLLEIAEGAPEEPLLRRVREKLHRPFDLLDLLFFCDDVLAAGDRGLRGKLVWVSSGRARSAGITIHPDDVFKKNAPRLYGDKGGVLNIDKPQRPAHLPPAKDGDVLGPEWSARFRNPATPKAMLNGLAKENRSGTYPARIKSIRAQVRAQKGEFYLYTTVRSRRRGYLMWGAFMLSRRRNAASLRAGLDKLERVNEQWGLHVPIHWRHPDGWRATIEAARKMSDAYDVVFATEKGAKSSNHYGGQAVDMAGLALPRTFTLAAPDGAERTFDLSDPNETRDISLTPELVRFVEAHFQMRKLIFDYPHWDDVAPRP